MTKKEWTIIAILALAVVCVFCMGGTWIVQTFSAPTPPIVAAPAPTRVTATNTPLPPTVAPTNTPMPTQTSSPTFTPVPPTATSTSTATSVPIKVPTPTATPVPAKVSTPTATRVVIATKSPTAKPTVNTSLSESEYGDAFAKISEDYKALSQLGKLLADAGDNPSLMFDNVWAVQVAYNIFRVKDCNKRIRELKPPLRYVASHAAVIEATIHYDKAMDLLVYALDHFDADKMKQSVDEIALGTVDWQRAVALIK